MALNTLLVFATTAEAEILKRIPGISPFGNDYKFGEIDISVLITGVGGIFTAWAMKKWLGNNSLPDLAVNIGIAGCFSDDLKKGDVVVPVSECFADMAIESQGKNMTLGEAGLMDPDEYPFQNGCIRADNKFVKETLKTLRSVNAITVNTSSGTKSTIKRLKNKFNPDIETMEGATFFYICSMERIPFLGVRAISNRIEPRNMKSWNIPLALENLAVEINNILTILK